MNGSMGYQQEMERFHQLLLEEERSQATREKYMRDVRAFLRYIGEDPISKERVICYKQYLVKKYAASSVNSMLAAANRFLKSIGRYDCTVRSLKIQRRAFRASQRELSKAEYYRLLAAAKRRKDTRLYMLMQAICATGIRVSELQFITVESLRSGVAQVSLKGKTRQILIPSKLRKELRRYASEKGIGSGSIFITKTGRPMDRSNILHAMKLLCREANVEPGKVFPHNLRHLFACLYYKASKDISRLADLLGHANINTTRIYTCVSGSEQSRQIDKLGLAIKNTA